MVYFIATLRKNTLYLRRSFGIWQFSQIIANFWVMILMRRKFRYIILFLVISSLMWFLPNNLPARLTRDGDKNEVLTCHGRIQGQSRWPPKNLSEIVHPDLGLFDLTLRPSVSLKPVNRQPWDSYYRILNVLHADKHINGSHLRKFFLLDKEQRDAGGRPDYDAYPQNLDITRTVIAVKSGLPVDQPPVNDPELLVLNSPKVTCNNPRGRGGDSRYPLDLVVLVKSCFSCYERRNRARSTYMNSHLWTGFRVQFAFVVGVPFLSDTDVFHFNGLDVSNTWKRLASKVQVREESQKLQNESVNHNDLLIGGFRDTYYNLTLKLMLAFRWASVFCDGQTPLFLFLDDDMAVIPANLIRRVQSIPDSDKLYLNGGFFRGFMPVLRPHKDKRHNRWSVSEDEFPWRIYPPYSSGAGYMVGAEMVRDASIAMAFTRYYRIDDAYLGIVWMKLKYPLMAIPGFRLSMKLENFNDTLIASMVNLDQYMDWQNGVPKDIFNSHRPPLDQEKTKYPNETG